MTQALTTTLAPQDDRAGQDGQVKLFYNNGRGSIQASTLCPDPLWPVADEANVDCWVDAMRVTQ